MKIVRARATGVLEVRTDDRATDLYFDSGVLVYAEGGTVDDTLGRMLVRQGVLDEAQYAAVIAEMTKEVFESEVRRFGEVAVALGFVPRGRIEEALADQVRQKFLHCLTWPNARRTFIADPSYAAEGAAFPLRVPPLVLEGLRSRMGRTTGDRTIEPLIDRPVALRDRAEAIAFELGLSADERRFLDRIDGTRTPRELIAAGSNDEAGARSFLAALIALACVDRAAPAPQAPSAPRKDPTGPISIRREDNPPTEVSLAAARLRARQLQAAAIKGAPAGRAQPAPDPALSAPLKAEKAFQAGKRFVANGAWPPAMRELEVACSCMPEVVEYQLYLLWARFQSGTSDDPKTLKAELERLSTRRLKEDVQAAFAHYVRGYLFRLAGDDARAAKAFVAAAKLDPSNADAVRLARMLAKK